MPKTVLCYKKNCLVDFRAATRNAMRSWLRAIAGAHVALLGAAHGAAHGAPRRLSLAGHCKFSCVQGAAARVMPCFIPPPIGCSVHK